MEQKQTIPVFYPRYPIREWKNFLYLSLSLGTRHIDESVFAFILEWKSRKFQQDKEKQFIHHLYGYLAHSAPIIIRVWGIVYLSTALREPPFR